MPDQMENLLVSACLLGEKVRYNGSGQLVDHPFLAALIDAGRVITVCPEVDGGLPTPRPPAEIQSSGSAVRVVTINAIDVTEQFTSGANNALEVAKKEGCAFALMAARSPSCGNQQIYDGSYSGKLIEGSGITAELLQRNGIQVFNQYQLDDLEAAMTQAARAQA
ncbi:DUF523 domain-containing protein [Reinekea marinisedimentorum]|uniref:Uncharacterized protein YbbK (DUF523 family) n=1 Tax=Reinekea marinisedimentorum TaxID=230495 RepID=A0A4R3IE25_9GAMM|nr:DUF523 domain-containing protein [Reinekea marinisedimentorum]TCS43031.1 uncharacterized protein YbbK (DUF523 family) [Reinekea marinisedimentorum]